MFVFLYGRFRWDYIFTGLFLWQAGYVSQSLQLGFFSYFQGQAHGRYLVLRTADGKPFSAVENEANKSIPVLCVICQDEVKKYGEPLPASDGLGGPCAHCPSHVILPGMLSSGRHCPPLQLPWPLFP